jgi:hypothetical protein
VQSVQNFPIRHFLGRVLIIMLSDITVTFPGCLWEKKWQLLGIKTWYQQW